MTSLLGQFYTRIKGSQEDIASEGLVYILQRSSAARLALSKIIQADCGVFFEDISYRPQSIGEQQERPDISGLDKQGAEVLILEAKFWAALTENQPITYLNRLGSGSVLMFVCPTLRVRPVYNELLMRLRKAEINFVSDDNAHSLTLDHDKKLIVKTWQEILGIIRLHLVQDNEQVLLSDIDQLIGFCETIDNNSFHPYQSDDFAPSIAKKINSFYDLADKVIDELKKRGLADTNRLKATPQKYGYARYFYLGSMSLSFNVWFNYWERVADTPFWLRICDVSESQYFVQSDSFKAKIKNVASKNSIMAYENISKEVYLPIFPLLDKTEDVVIADISEQIMNLVGELAESSMRVG